MCDLTMKMLCYKRGSIFDIRISGGKYQNIIIQDLFYHFVQIFCIRLNKVDFVMAMVALVSVVALESLVI